MEMKKAFVLLWHGITGIFSGIADWFTVILGMRDDSKYGRFLRRVVGSCFALIMLFVTSAACVGFFEAIKKHLDDERLCFDDTSEYAQYLSRGITYYDGVYGKDGYVKDSNGEKTVNITGMQAMNKEVVWEGDNNDMKTTDGAALMLVDSSLIEVVDEPYQEATSIDITYTGNLFVGSSLQLTASLEGETITWATSDSSVATVDENGLVTGVSEGTVTISASTESGAIGVITLTASVRQGEPDYLHASVAEVLEAQNTKEQAYVVRGKIKGFGSKGDQTAIDQFGNIILVDEEDATKEILVYGISATYTALSYDEATGEYKFSNPKDANTHANTKDLKVGDTISMVAIRSDYKDTKEIVGVLAATNDTRIAPTKATLKEVVEGAPLSATSATASGQYIYEVTATIKSWATNKPGATEYGDMVVTDESGLEVAVYGATAQDGKISYNYNGSGKYSIGNPKDWLTNEVTKDLKVGDKITFTCVRSDYNGNIQIVCDNVRLAE